MHSGVLATAVPCCLMARLCVYMQEPQAAQQDGDSDLTALHERQAQLDQRLASLRAQITQVGGPVCVCVYVRQELGMRTGSTSTQQAKEEGYQCASSSTVPRSLHTVFTFAGGSRVQQARRQAQRPRHSATTIRCVSWATHMHAGAPSTLLHSHAVNTQCDLETQRIGA